MRIQHLYLPVTKNIGGQDPATEWNAAMDSTSPQEIFFTNGSSGKKINRLITDDETDLRNNKTSDGSVFPAEGIDISADSDDMAGATGPGSDRKGDKMPGEDGITSLTDGIADFIDKKQDKD